MTNNQTAQHYQNEMATLSPQGQPALKIFYRPAHPTPGKQQIGVLDASYNPFTLAHEALLKCSFEALLLNEMILMLSRANVDKEIFGANLGQRLTMLIDYAQHHTHHAVVGGSHARFVDKIQALQTQYTADATFYFIVGYDTLIRLFDPKYYNNMHNELRTFFSSAHIITANRETHDKKAIQTFLQHPDRADFASHIHIITLPETVAHISSTLVRQQIQQKKPVAHLVPECIALTIQKLGLYQP
jgi:nicotinic acid mononucleotide adenylyltransferase